MKKKQLGFVLLVVTVSIILGFGLFLPLEKTYADCSPACVPPRECQMNVCNLPVGKCSTAADCPSGQVCNNNTCAAATGGQTPTAGGCGSGPACSTGQSCISGVCQTTGAGQTPSGTAPIAPPASGTTTTSALKNPLGTIETIDALAINLIKGALNVLAVIGVAVIVYGGFLYVTSAGSEERVKKAKSVITYAILGTVIVIASRIIVQFVITTIGA